MVRVASETLSRDLITHACSICSTIAIIHTVIIDSQVRSIFVTSIMSLATSIDAIDCILKTEKCLIRVKQKFFFVTRSFAHCLAHLPTTIVIIIPYLSSRKICNELSETNQPRWLRKWFCRLWCARSHGRRPTRDRCYHESKKNS